MTDRPGFAVPSTVVAWWWHPVQKAVGTLDTEVLHGCYFIEFGPPSSRGIAYPIELFSDVRLTRAAIEAGPACERQAPKLLDE